MTDKLDKRKLLDWLETQNEKDSPDYDEYYRGILAAINGIIHFIKRGNFDAREKRK